MRLTTIVLALCTIGYCNCETRDAEAVAQETDSRPQSATAWPLRSTVIFEKAENHQLLEPLLESLVCASLWGAQIGR